MIRVIEWLHATLIFALFIPVLYMFGDFIEPGGAVVLYLKCLLVAVPVIVTGIAAERRKTLVGYLAVCGVMIAIIWCAVGLLPRLISQNELEIDEICYAAGILVEAFFIAGVRLNSRLREARRVKDEGSFAESEASFLDKPSLAVFWYFAIVYAIGMGFDTKYLCDMAFFSMVVYLFPVLIYKYIGTTQHYLSMNKRTSGISGKRLYVISGGMFFLFCMLLLVAVLPSVFLAGSRHYIDLQDLLSAYDLAPMEWEGEAEFQGANTNMGAMQMIFDDIEPAPEPSKVVNVLIWVIGIACVAVAVYALIMAIRQIFADFRKDMDENGDKVEELDELSYKKEILSLFRRREADSETARIKRLYKKTIRKHRKDQPAPYESPIEIEENAGLRGDEQMQVLHKQYEEVRYKG